MIISSLNRCHHPYLISIMFGYCRYEWNLMTAIEMNSNENISNNITYIRSAMFSAHSFIKEEESLKTPVTIVFSFFFHQFQIDKIQAIVCSHQIRTRNKDISVFSSMAFVPSFAHKTLSLSENSLFLPWYVHDILLRLAGTNNDSKYKFV